MLLLFCFLSAQEEWQDNDFSDVETVDTFLDENIDYYYELIKFYLNEQEYDLALSYLDSIMINPTDSLYFFKGKALKGKKNWQEAANNFALAIQFHRSDTLYTDIENEFRFVLGKMPAMDAITLLSVYLNSIDNNEILTKFLVIMAEIYEENQLFDEANDVYATILKETDYPRQIPMQMKIATNQIFLEKYDEAIKTLSPIVALNDSIYNADALFFYYLANYSVDRFEIAGNALLKLYKDYPDHPKRTEILTGLADVYEKEGQFLVSWFFLNELQSISSEAQKFLVQKQIDDLRKKIGTENIQADQFEYLELNLNHEEDE